MVVAADLDHATDSQRDWIAEHTRRYPASGGIDGHESEGVLTRPRRRCLLPSGSRVVGEDAVRVVPGSQ